MNVVILAAGMGKRMQSDLPKVLHALAGKPLLLHVIDTARSLSPQRCCVVYGHGGDLVPQQLAADDLHFALQEPQLGTGHAVTQALPVLDDTQPTLVLYGDVPLTTSATLQKLVAAAGKDKLAVLTVDLDDPTGYGRIVREKNKIVRIVEQKDANETERLGDTKEGSVSAFAVNPADGQLKLLNEVPSGGAGPTYVSIHPSGRFLFVANYFGGSVSVLPILQDGSLGPATDTKVAAGSLGPKKATSAPPGSFAFSGHDRTHAHMIQADPSGHFVLHVDLGLDRIFVWKFDAQKGILTPHDPPAVALPPGDGPRHFHFHPNGRWLYSIQEEGSNIVHFDYNAGHLTPRLTVSTLPPGFAGSNFCSEILVSADGRFLYAGNRLHDSIAIFSIGETGALTALGEEWTRGDYPRSFNFDPRGQFLYCCNQRADHLATFRVDPSSGGLQFTGQYTPVGNPSCIVFLDLAKPPGN